MLDLELVFQILRYVFQSTVGLGDVYSETSRWMITSGGGNIFIFNVIFLSHQQFRCRQLCSSWALWSECTATRHHCHIQTVLSHYGACHRLYHNCSGFLTTMFILVCQPSRWTMSIGPTLVNGLQKDFSYFLSVKMSSIQILTVWKWKCLSGTFQSSRKNPDSFNGPIVSNSQSSRGFWAKWSWKAECLPG